MKEIYTRLLILKNEITKNYRYDYGKVTYFIQLLEQAIETIIYIRNHPEATKEEIEIAIGFGKYLIYLESLNVWAKNSHKSQEKIRTLQQQLESEIELTSQMEQLKYQYKDLNQWISSLNIGKFRNNGVVDEKYLTSYEIYSDLRQIFISKKVGCKEQIYTGKIVDRMEDKQNTLDSNCKIEVADYELSQLIKIIKNNPNFNYRLMDHNCKTTTINETLEREIQLSTQRILVKQLKLLSKDIVDTNLLELF